jgi:hypothetical protein
MSLPLSASKPHIARIFLEIFNNATSPVEVIEQSYHEEADMNDK